ncbi:MAG: hypothetical protein WAW23_05630 [Candidatus Methanoperedens sp.]
MAHRKLTERERDRMINLHASAPLGYIPAIDDELIKLGLVQFWDETQNVVDSTDIPFYGANGRILPEWCDFKAEKQEKTALISSYHCTKCECNHRTGTKIFEEHFEYACEHL